MSLYVVDTTVIVARLIQEQYTVKAKALFQQLTAQDELAIPNFCIAECVNVLWKKVRFGGLLHLQAKTLIEDLNELPLTLYLIDELYQDALDLGLTHQLIIYDALYIALAQELNCSLITIDQKQAAAAQSEEVILKPMTDFAL